MTQMAAKARHVLFGRALTNGTSDAEKKLHTGRLFGLRKAQNCQLGLEKKSLVPASRTSDTFAPAPVWNSKSIFLFNRSLNEALCTA